MYGARVWSQGCGRSGRARRAVLASSVLAALLVPAGCVQGGIDDENEERGAATAHEASSLTGPVLGAARCNDRIRLKSWKGDYLHRPDTAQGVTSYGVPEAIGNAWTVECLSDGNVQLRSWKGDYLHRPDSAQGVTTWGFGAWTVVPGTGGGFMLRSWKGDYLHRPDSPQGVTTWDQGTWTAEVLVMGGAACNDHVRLISWKGDYLARPDTDAEPRATTSATGDNQSAWNVECLADGTVQLRSWRGDYLHRPDSPQGVTTWGFGAWTVVPGAFNTFMLRSWKGDYLHRPDSPQGVTTWDQGTWSVAVLADAARAALVAKFAPRLRFDGAGHGYPMSAQTFYDADIVNHNTARLENNDVATLGTGTLPTYYQVTECGAQVRIKYWWFYGYQNTCDGVSGSHNGDWENVVVTLAEDRNSIAAITFSMHGHTYTRLAARDGFSLEDATHPVVYVAKNSHASIFEQGGSSTSCLPWEEFRNNGDGSHLDSWTRLVSLDSGTEPWMIADRQGGFVWGPDGISNHPTTAPPSCTMNAADWTFDVPTWWHSQCKRGDRDDGTSCHTQCRPGYTDMGLTCTNWSIFSLDTYGQHIYGYDYKLPTSDLGLLTNDYD